ncbi:hypothetical protein FRC17_005135 [Serendipita sp. 399]|nr:hypothetical protein FRC17_005135 [Serendipita sp. 399]
MSVGSGVGVGLKLDDICDGFLKDIDEDAQESGSELLFMTEKSSPRKRGIAQVQKQRSFEKFLSPQESKAAHKAPSLPSTIASAPPTILTFGTTRSRAQSFGNAQAPVRLPQSISTTESDSGSSMYSALSQMTPTKNSRSLRRQDVPMLSFDRQRAVMTPSSGEKCAQLVASVSGASLSSLPYLRSPEFAHEVGVAACDKHEPLLPSQPSSQTFPTLESDDLIHYPVRNPPPEIDTVSDLPVIPPKEAHFVSQPPFAHSQHQDPRASIWSVTSTNSQFSQFSLSLFPSPPSVPIVRPTTDKGTFPSSMSEAEGLVVPETENGQNTLPYRFKSIVPSRRTPRLQRMLLTDDLSTLSSHSRSNSNSSYPLTVGESSQQPGSPRTESPLPPPNYAALLRSMEAPGPLDTSGTGVYVGHPEEKTPSAFGNYGLGYTRGLPNIVSEENARPGSANSRLQWGYAL